ncbi:TPA: putative 3',5'-cyclic phosphodiesterase pde-3 [Trebouxia sp. C0005]
MPLSSPGVSGPYHYSERDARCGVDDEERVWPLDSLDLLDKLGTPVWLAIASAHSDSTSPGGFQNTVRPIYQNAACKRSLGSFRSQGDIKLRLNNQTLPEKQNRKDLYKQLLPGTVHRSWVQAQSLLSPVFDGLPEDQRHLTLLQQVLKVETSPGLVETCQLNQVEQVASEESARLAAMHHLGPIHTFMFSQTGRLLMANKRGRERYVHLNNGADICLLDLFQQGVYTDMQTTPEAAFEEAMRHIFVQKEEVHRFAMPNTSRKHPNKARWTLFEMWPINDPVTGHPAVLTKLYNVTQQKQMEAELQTQKEALARQLQQLEEQKQQLEHYNATIQEEKDSLLQQNTSLTERLEAVVTEKRPSHQFDGQTPIDKTLDLLQNLIMGRTPDNEETVALFHLLSQANVDLRQPVSLEEQLMEDNDMDADVGLAMVQLLKGNTSRSPPPPTSSSSGGIELPSSPSTPQEMYSRSRARRSSMVSTSSITSEASLDVELEFGMTACITLQVERMLQDAEKNWQFNMFKFAEETNGNHLSVLTFHYIKTAGLCSRFNLNEAKLSRFLCRIERGYLNNPYHSSLHVASVVQMMHMIMHHGGLLRRRVFDELMILACYISAAVHDYEHGGVNNDFLIQTRDRLAVTYNDISPLENHHLAAAARLMSEPKYRFTDGLSRADHRTLRTAVIEQVLGTDMKKHFNILSRFQNLYQRSTTTSSRSGSRELKENTFQRRDTTSSRSSSMELPEDLPHRAPPRHSIDIRQNTSSRHSVDISRAHSVRPSGAAAGQSSQLARGSTSSSDNSVWDNVSEENKGIIRQVALKCADIGHLAATPDVHKRWAYLLEEEFFLQGDREKQLGMAVSPLMDRQNKGGITRSQLSFFSIVGIPLFKSMTDIFEETRPMLQGVMENYKAWEKDAAMASTPFASPRP